MEIGYRFVGKTRAVGPHLFPTLLPSYPPTFVFQDAGVCMYPKQLEALTEHIFYLPHYDKTDRPVLGAVCGKDAALVVDAGASAAHARLFLRELEKHSPSRPRYMAVTHWHWDHVFGIHEMDLLTMAHVDTVAKVKEMAALDWGDEALDRRVAEGTEIEFCRECLKLELPERDNLVLRAPDIGFHDKLEIHLGELECVIEHVGGDHSADSSVVFVPRDRVLFIGDCIYPDLYHGETYTTERLFPLMDRLLAFDADIYIDSHKPPLSREAMTQRCTEIRRMGKLAETHGKNQKAITTAWKKATGTEPDQDDWAVLDCFLAGRQ